MIIYTRSFLKNNERLNYMNIKEYVSYARKEHVYDCYTNVIKETKEYEKITRRKICLDILDYIKDIEHFTSLITYKEYNALINLYNDNYQEDDKIIYKNLSNRLLTIFDFKEQQYVIFDEYKDIIYSHLQHMNVEALKQRENFDMIVPAIIKAYGMLSYEHIKACLKHYLPNYHSHYELFENTDNYLQYYSYDIYFFDGYILDKRFDYFYDEIRVAYTQFDHFIKDDYFIPKKDLLSIKENDLNLNSKNNNKLYIELKNNFESYMIDNMIEKLRLFVHIQAIIDENTFNYQFYKQKINNLLPLIQKVSREIPSAIFHGLTEKQFLKKYPNFKDRNQAKLPTDDAFLFFKLYFGLLEYTNNKYHIQPKLKKIYQQINLPPELIIPIRDYLFKHLNIIDQFIRKNPFHFTKEELELVNNFKYSISDTFIIMKYDDEFAYLMGRNGNFLVKGLHSTIEDVIPKYALPYVSPMNLIPFKDVIIYDGIITGPTVQFSSKMIKQFQKEFKNNTNYDSIYIPTRVS